MKVTLFLMNKIKDFNLPSQFSGSYTFGIDEEENNLFYIEAENNNWIISGVDNTIIYYGNQIIDKQIIQPFTFYIAQKEGISYLIYISPSFDKSISKYSVTDNYDLIIGNSSNCNIIYNCPYLSDCQIQIKKQNNNITITKSNNLLIYINKVALTSNSSYLKVGDSINICGLRLTILPNMILINNPNNTVIIDQIKANISTITLNSSDNLENLEIKDRDLYDKDSYFSKSPRIRRIIETKKIKLDQPPGGSGSEEMPLILTLGPMITMGLVSALTLITTISKIASKETTIEQSWTQLLTGGSMLISTMFWPLLTSAYNKHVKKHKDKELTEKYDAYLAIKKEELLAEQRLQKSILIENLITLPECINMINNKNLFFWDKRIEQNDFLDARIGVGKVKLDVEVEYPESGFTIDESQLKKKADSLVEEFKYIENVPIPYSFSKHKMTGIMGDVQKGKYFIDNILLQLITFYSYDDLKIVLFTNKDSEEHWKYIKYLNYNFDNSKQIRFFASNTEEVKNVTNYLSNELNYRLQAAENTLFKPHYLIICDDYDLVRNTDFIKNITEIDASLGFSLVILEQHISKLPSKCVNFIQIGSKESGVMENSYEKQELINFKDEVNYGIDMLAVAKIVSNIPIEFENSIKGLPEMLNFLEMEHVGKVEQLNILNRWKNNDPISSLKAEIGYDENGDLMFLDIHEKSMGPHGLIAGTTGSGKSEFIITYILSLAINYSPDEIAFILIDYKGGGLALAFENKTAGIYLPHLAGTITNLDKAEMDRTLVSIDSEVKRRQKMFNEARETLGESTIDIYKYQQFYRDGKLSEPLPHLLIICDEFAELKSQQPDFMDNLISVARIGRSLGVHLILATQKPSGVVNDQIWSNSRFKVCLKVQDASDSKEMLKREDAASIKEAGRFYLQVGYDEYFGLGQSGWAGAKYYPSDSIQKEVDKSINFINNNGVVIKSVQGGKSKKIEAQGDQLTSIVSNVMEVAKQINKKTRMLWLPNIPEVILVDELRKKYNYIPDRNNVEAIIGEEDIPERQEQILRTYSLLDDGNTLIFGVDSAEREMLLGSIIYSTSVMYNTSDIIYYLYDFGSESLRKFSKMPQLADTVYIGDDERFNSLLKLIKEEITNRKKLFTNYNGEYKNYIKNVTPDKKIPIMTIIINNYTNISETYKNFEDDIAPLVRDSTRYGIVFIITDSAYTAIPRLVKQNFNNAYALNLNDKSDYQIIFNSNKKITPREMFGRALCFDDDLHEFQTASLLKDNTDEIEKLAKVGDILSQKIDIAPKKIPSLPEQLTFDIIKDAIVDIKNVPIGMIRESLRIERFDFTANKATIISSNKLDNLSYFSKSLIKVLLNIKNIKFIVMDVTNTIESEKMKIYREELDTVMKNFFESAKKNSTINHICLMYGLEKIKNSMSESVLEEITRDSKTQENFNFILIDQAKTLKGFDYDDWYGNIKNNTDGIWIGKGVDDQNVFRISPITKDMTVDYGNNYGYSIEESSGKLIKVIEFEKIPGDDEDE